MDEVKLWRMKKKIIIVVSSEWIIIIYVGCFPSHISVASVIRPYDQNNGFLLIIQTWPYSETRINNKK